MPRKVILLLGALAVAGGAAYLALNDQAPAVAPAPTVAPASAPPTANATAAERPKYVEESVPAAAEERARLQPNPHLPGVYNYPIAAVRGYSSESTQFMGFVLGQDVVPVSTAELEKLLDEYIIVVRQRAAYEAAIAKVESITDNEVSLTIPPYAEVGGRLEDDLYARFSSVIGDERTAALRDAIGSGLYMRNFGFGDAAHTIRITLRDSEPEIRYDISLVADTLTIVTKLNKGQTVPLSVTNAGHTSSGATLDDFGQFSAFAQYLPKGSPGR